MPNALLTPAAADTDLGGPAVTVRGVPDWLTVIIACATPGMAYLGMLTATRHSRTGAVETEAGERHKQNLEVLLLNGLFVG